MAAWYIGLPSDVVIPPNASLKAFVIGSTPSASFQSAFFMMSSSSEKPM